MSSENTERRMEFIIEQQARFSADMSALDVRLGRLTASAEKHDQQIGNLADALLSLTNIVEQEREEADGRSREIDERFRETSQQIKEIAQRSKETEERLNALIAVVERIISGPK